MEAKLPVYHGLLGDSIPWDMKEHAGAAESKMYTDQQRCIKRIREKGVVVHYNIVKSIYEMKKGNSTKNFVRMECIFLSKEFTNHH